jgi:sortase A
MPVERPVVTADRSAPTRPGKGRRRLTKADKRQLAGDPAAAATPAKKGRRAPVPLDPGTYTMLWIIVALGGLAAWFVAYAFGFSALQEHASQRVLFGQLREQLALATAPVGGVIPPGDPVAILDIPDIGINDMVIVEGTSSATLQSGPGHLRNTALPGQEGVSVVLGRSVTFGAPFRRINDLSPGDTVEVTTGQGRMLYRVSAVRWPGDPLPPLPAAGESRLTLVSSEGLGKLGPMIASTAVYVDATLQGKVKPTPSGRPAAIAGAEQPMAVDTSNLMPLVLWLEALLLVAIGLVWSARRWGGWQSWIVGVPLVVAVLWGTTAAAFGLLPNLL